MAAARPSAAAAAAAAALALALTLCVCPAAAAAAQAGEPAGFGSLTGGCLNATGSGRLSQKHVDVLLQQLTILLQSTVGKDAFGRAFRPLIAGSVRLAFHSCAGYGCEGCINVNNPANSGLNITIAALSDFRDRLLRVPQFADCTLTHSDLWQASAAAALKIAVFDQKNSKVCGVQVVFGRADCDTAPYTDAVVPYPDRRSTIDQLLAFAAKLGLTAEQFVALMNMHSLGVVRDFNGRVMAQWDEKPDAANDTTYFQTIANQASLWKAVPFSYTSKATPVMYSFSKDAPTKRFIYLTSDFSLAYKITEKDPTVTGQPTSPLVRCPFSSTRSHVLRFAASSTAWVKVFCGAWSALMTRGYAPGALQPGAAVSG